MSQAILTTLTSSHTETLPFKLAVHKENIKGSYPGSWSYVPLKIHWRIAVLEDGLSVDIHKQFIAGIVGGIVLYSISNNLCEPGNRQTCCASKLWPPGNSWPCLEMMYIRRPLAYFEGEARRVRKGLSGLLFFLVRYRGEEVVFNCVGFIAKNQVWARLRRVFCVRAGACFFSFRGFRLVTSARCGGRFFARFASGFRWCLAVLSPSPNGPTEGSAAWAVALKSGRRPRRRARALAGGLRLVTEGYSGKPPLPPTPGGVTSG